MLSFWWHLESHCRKEQDSDPEPAPYLSQSYGSGSGTVPKCHGSTTLKVRGLLGTVLGMYSVHTCAANFSFAQLAKRKSLGRSKPATNSKAQALQHTVWNVFTISKPY